MIQQWIDRIPMWLLSILAVVGVLLYMISSEPPETVCHAQMEVVGKNLNKYFTRRKDGGWSYKSRDEDKYKFCIKSNSAGGCYEILQRFNYLEKQARTVPLECAGHDTIQVLRPWMSRSLILMARLAWGTKPPDEETQRVGWLDEATVSLHCRMTREYIRLFGKKQMQGLIRQTMKQLPGIETVYQKDRKEKTLFSFPCRQYLR